MKQTVMEWFSNEISEIIGKVPFSKEQEEKLIHTLEKAKEMENQQQDELAIEFAEWCDSKTTQVSKGEWVNWIHDAKNCFSSKELLEKYKNK